MVLEGVNTWPGQLQEEAVRDSKDMGGYEWNRSGCRLVSIGKGQAEAVIGGRTRAVGFETSKAVEFIKQSVGCGGMSRPEDCSAGVAVLTVFEVCDE